MIRYCFTTLLIILSWVSVPKAFGQEPVVKQLPLSTAAANELAPVLNDSVLYFISNRKTSLLATYVDQKDELLYRLFSAPLNSDRTLGPCLPFSPSGDPLINQGPITFSPSGTTIIMTQNKPRLSKRRKASPLLGLFKSEKKMQKWGLSLPIKFNGTATNISIAHPSLSADGQRLYFVSDMKEGYGQTDIYVSKRLIDGWDTPVNLGEKVNTSGKELFPFIHPSGLLFFTSNGPDGKKDLDIYCIDPTLPNAVATPLPSPINSEYDDFSCYIFEDTGHGYFASNRQGQDDLYEFTTPETHENLQQITEDNYCFTFFENGPDTTDSLPKIYRWSFGDGEEAYGLEADHCFEGPGNYTVMLNVVDTLSNEELFSVATYNLELTETKQIWFEVPDTLKTGELFMLHPSLKGYAAQPEQPVYYWNFGDGIRQVGETLSHIYRKKGTYRIICSTNIETLGKVSFFREVTVVD